MRVFLNKWFAKFAHKERISAEAIVHAIRQVESGLVDADLGGNIIKQRIPRQGSGKSGGYRVVIVFRAQERAFFVYGFAKKNRENLTSDELAQYKKLGEILLGLGDDELASALQRNILSEVDYDEQDI